eukprot:8699458-Heterocapsa_arctica.AAC.1
MPVASRCRRRTIAAAPDDVEDELAAVPGGPLRTAGGVFPMARQTGRGGCPPAILEVALTATADGEAAGGGSGGAAR